MFSGIVTHLGRIEKKTENSLGITADSRLIQKLHNGTSMAVNGVCLTVVSTTKNSFAINFMPETANRTNIQNLKVQDIVNLELPATPETFLSGHIMQGHVDEVGKITEIINVENSRLFTFSVPKKITKYIVEKGSIAVNGISLTVISVDKNTFTVGIIPFTWDYTMLHTTKVGDLVNIEVDVFAKYVEKLILKK